MIPSMSWVFLTLHKTHQRNNSPCVLSPGQQCGPCVVSFHPPSSCGRRVGNPRVGPILISGLQMKNLMPRNFKFPSLIVKTEPSSGWTLELRSSATLDCRPPEARSWYRLWPLEPPIHRERASLSNACPLIHERHGESETCT